MWVGMKVGVDLLGLLVATCSSTSSYGPIVLVQYSRSEYTRTLLLCGYPECACDWVRCDFHHIYVTGYGIWVPSSGSEVNTSVGISHIPKGHVPVGKVVGMIIQGTHHRPGDKNAKKVEDRRI